MKTRMELLATEGYWRAKMQTQLYGLYVEYGKKSVGLDKSKLSKNVLKKIKNGDAELNFTQLINFCMPLGIAPVLTFKKIKRE